MKRIFALFILFVPLALFAQDKIFTRKGAEIKARILEVAPDYIKYKRFSNPEGATFIINITDVKSVQYENGDVDNYEAPDVVQGPQEITLPPALNNSSLIAEINTTPRLVNDNIKPGAKSLEYMAFMGVTDDSVLSNDEIEVSFSSYLGFFESQLREAYYRYAMHIRNKTDHYVYLDKASCFYFVNNTGYPFFQGRSTTTTSGNSVGVGVSMGAVASALGIGGFVGDISNAFGVSSGNFSMTSVTEQDQQILSIPPHQNVVFFEDFEIPRFNIESGVLRVGEFKEYSYESSPAHWAYFLAYSFSKDFSVYSSLKINAYCRFLYGFSNQVLNKTPDFRVPYNGVHTLIPTRMTKGKCFWPMGFKGEGNCYEGR